VSTRGHQFQSTGFIVYSNSRLAETCKVAATVDCGVFVRRAFGRTNDLLRFILRLSEYFRLSTRSRHSSCEACDIVLLHHLLLVFDKPVAHAGCFAHRIGLCILNETTFAARSAQKFIRASNDAFVNVCHDVSHSTRSSALT
jgi:hypothetical protein